MFPLSGNWFGAVTLLYEWSLLVLLTGLNDVTNLIVFEGIIFYIWLLKEGESLH